MRSPNGFGQRVRGARLDVEREVPREAREGRGGEGLGGLAGRRIDCRRVANDDARATGKD